MNNVTNFYTFALGQPTTNKKNLDNKQYIAGLLAHDSKVLKAIYANYASRIQYHIQQKGGTIDDAKDVFHDALMVIYQKAKSPDFELTSQFYTYLYSVCHFIWDRKRKKKANNTVTIPEDSGLTIEEDLEENILQRERHLIFKQNFQKLGQFCQQILQLFFAKKNMTEIAKVLDLKNEHTARTRKYRCQKELEKLVRSDVRYLEIRTQ